MARLYRIIKFLVPLVSLVVTTADSLLLQNVGSAYRGKYLGPLTSRKHSVSGHVYAVDSRTLHLQGFTYDGTGPDAFFWIGFTESPSPQGIIVPNERGTKEVLTAYNGADVTISLPDGLTLRDIKWFAVWCRAYEVNFGDLYIPPNFDFPQPHVIGSIVGQGVASGPIVVVDAQTILVPDFTYDGQAPDLHFWVGRGTPGPDGIRVPDETGGDATLARADKKTLVLSLPGDLTIFDIDYFGLWSRLYGIDYGHVRIQPGLNVPPSLRMLGISPQLLSVTPSPYLQTTTAAAAYTQQFAYGYHDTNALVHQSVAAPTYVQTTATTAVAPLAQQQYFHILETQKPVIHQPTHAVHYNTALGSAIAAPQGNLYTYHQASTPTFAAAPIHTNHIAQDGLLYSHTPLTAAATTTALSGGYHTIGANGFSTYTLRTSQGTATAAALY